MSPAQVSQPTLYKIRNSRKNNLQALCFCASEKYNNLISIICIQNSARHEITWSCLFQFHCLIKEHCIIMMIEAIHL